LRMRGARLRLTPIMILEQQTAAGNEQGLCQ
jgi:hypothetical protein